MVDRPELNEDFLDLLRAFLDAGVDFLVEADALVGELGLGGFELAAPEAIEAVGAEDVRGAFGVEIEGVAAIEFDGHGDTSLSVEKKDRQSSRSIEVVEFEVKIFRNDIGAMMSMHHAGTVERWMLLR